MRPTDRSEVAGAVHVVRALQRQLSTQLVSLADHSTDPTVRRSLEDAAQREEQSCAILTGLLAQIDEPPSRLRSASARYR